MTKPDDPVSLSNQNISHVLKRFLKNPLGLEARSLAESTWAYGSINIKGTLRHSSLQFSMLFSIVKDSRIPIMKQ